MKMTPEGIALFIVVIMNITSIIERSLGFKDRADKPHKELEEKVDRLDDEIQEIKNKLKNDNWRIEQLEEGGRVLLKSMGALLTHGIDGNNIEEMKLAREELNEYLIRR